MASMTRRHIYGVDFSGAKNAGQAMWIAGGVIEDGALRIEGCMATAALAHLGVGNDRIYAALVDIIAMKQDGIFGLDFPFSLPKELIADSSWEDFVRDFPRRYPSPEAFREGCRAAAGGKELKRATDRAAKTPFSAYNIRLYRQAYYGIGHVLRPLLIAGRAAVLPFQPAVRDLPWVIEICPASTLKAEGLYAPYKGRQPERRGDRLGILRELTSRYLSRPLPAAAEQAVQENFGGDALDSVVAAIAAHRALTTTTASTGPANEVEALEGRVYV